ncbi:hypothetical protein C7B67_29050, partial [filamentous cyanobacterium Phorm 6]
NSGLQALSSKESVKNQCVINSVQLLINIKNRAVGHPVLKAQLMSQAIAGVSEKPTPYYT